MTEIIPECIHIPTSREVGFVGPAAHLYDAQILLVQTIGKPEHFIDLSLQVISYTEFALAEAKPEERRAIQVRCQQTLAHHAFIARIFLDYMRDQNRQQTADVLLGFIAQLQSDVLAAFTESGANSCERVARGDVHAAKQAAPLAIAAALQAASKRFSTTGPQSISSFFSGLFRAGEIEGQRRRWLLGIETQLESVAARANLIGPSHTIADIGRRCANEIIAIHQTEWERKRFKMRDVAWFASCAVIFLIIIVAIFLGLPIAITVFVFWLIHLFKGESTPLPPPSEHPSQISVWWLVVGAVVVMPVCWILLTEFRRWIAISRVQRRLRRWIRAIETGKQL